MRKPCRQHRGRPMLAASLLVLALTPVAPLRAQESDAVVVDQEAIARGIVLREGWRFRGADDGPWADPGVDDGAWMSVDSAGIGAEQGWGRVGWLRRHLRVDPALGQVIVGLDVRQSGASEVFLDGRRVAGFGVVSGKREEEVAWDPPLPVAVVL